MKFASITDRLASLGSEKWLVHIEGKKRRARGEDLIFLSIGEPDLPPAQSILEAAKGALRPGNVGYKDSAGGPALRTVLSQIYTRAMGRAVGPEQCLFMPGTQAGLYVAFAAIIDQGDEVILLDPYYATYEAVVSAPGGVPRPVALDPDRDFHINFTALEHAITPKTKAILLNSPGNPTGTVYTADEIDRLSTLAKRHDLWIVSDEVYASIIHADRPHVSPFADPAMDERTVIVSSISKSHALPGFRCGWIVASAEFCNRVRPIFESMMFSTHPFLEDALVVALQQEFPENAVAKRAYFNRAKALLNGIDGSNRVRAHMPEGGMFAMVDIRPTGLTGDAFARRLLDEEKVVTMPGESFGAGGAGHLRVALTVDETVMEDAAKRIRNLADRI